MYLLRDARQAGKQRWSPSKLGGGLLYELDGILIVGMIKFPECVGGFARYVVNLLSQYIQGNFDWVADELWVAPNER